MNPYLVLLTDLEARYGRRVRVPFKTGDVRLVIDLLAQRRSDVYPSTRVLAIDPKTGAGTIKISTCFPDLKGKCERPKGPNLKDEWDGTTVERMRQVKGEYEVAPDLVALLLECRVIVTDEKKGAQYKIAPNERVLDFRYYQHFRKRNGGDIEYTPL